jgi:hypothetical protein
VKIKPVSDFNGYTTISFFIIKFLGISPKESKYTALPLPSQLITYFNIAENNESTKQPFTRK